MSENGGDFDFAFHHDRYKELVKRAIIEQGYVCRAPELAKGDVLLWNARTIHGSLETPDGKFSRRSFTGHYLPESHRFLQFQSRIKPLDIKPINGMNVHHAKDLARLSNRAVLAVETTYRRTFKSMKRLAIKFVTT